MKRLLQSLMLGMMLAAFALPALAQDTAAAQPAQDETAAKSAVYENFRKAFNRRKEISAGDPKLEKPGNKEAHAQAYKEANDFATEYLQKWPNETGQIPDYLKKFVNDYKNWVKTERKNLLAQHVKDKKFDQAFALGKEILAGEPNDLFAHYSLAQAGLAALDADNKSFNTQTAMYAKKGIQLVESGATYVPNQPLEKKDKDNALGLFNLALGMASLESMPADSIGAFIKVAALEAEANSKDPLTYYRLARAYTDAEYVKLATDYGAQCTTPEQLASPACVAMKDRLNIVADRIMDAYARAVSLSGTKPELAKAKVEWQKRLTDFYKFRNEGKETGLNEYVAGILTKPVPGPLPPAGAMPAPTTATPAPTPAATPSAAGNGNGAMTTSATTTGTTTTTPAATAPKTTPAPKPTASTPTKTTPKKAHASRRH